MSSRAATVTIAGVSALLALRPFGSTDQLADLVTLPSRAAAPLGFPATLMTELRAPRVSGADALQLADEARFSVQLEHAVLRSAWPTDPDLPRDNVDPVPGEVDARLGRKKDTIKVRVADPDRVELGQPVVAGDVYIGRVSRIPFREPLDDPEPLERLMRALRLSAPPLAPPRDAVHVALVTGNDQRVGGLVEEGEEGLSYAVVVGGVTGGPEESTWLAIHAPERRSTSRGVVKVSEPLGLRDSFEALSEGFRIGVLRRDEVERSDGFGTQEILGIQPFIDFEEGINQVLVLARSEGDEPVNHEERRKGGSVKRVLEDGGWGGAKLLVNGDVVPWRSTLRIDRGTRDGLEVGAALVEGVRLAGRVSDPGAMTSAVASVFDPGFSINVLAQSVLARSEDGRYAPPLAMGKLTSEGRAGDGSLLLRWDPDRGTAWRRWAESMSESGEARDTEVILWTGSGMKQVPRGLRIGRVTLPSGPGPSSDPEEGYLLRVSETASLRGPFEVRLGTERLVGTGGSADVSADGEAAPR